MIECVYHNGKLYISSHVLLDKIAHIGYKNVMKRCYLVSYDGEIYICGHVKKSVLEQLISTGDTEDCGVIRYMYRMFRKSGRRYMPIQEISKIKDYASELDRCSLWLTSPVKVRFSTRKRFV